MKKFNLNIYKDFQIYFNLLDVLIKNVSSNKELYLENINISPSSYRRVKKEGNKIGETILNKLAEHFDYNLCTNELIDEIEDKINKIYYDVYYKDYENYQIHYKWLDEMLSKRYIIYPIFQLFKLLMTLNNQDSPSFVIPENQAFYEEIRQYYEFLQDEFSEIIELLDVTFRKEVDDCFLVKKYLNELTYHTLASRCYFMKRYLESIYFCNIVKEKYIHDENYKRVYYINLTLISNYNFLLSFDDACLLAQKQLKTLESTKNLGMEYELTKKSYIVTCLGLKKYNDIINMLSNKERMKLTEICCLLISFYYVDKEKYINLMNELLMSDKNSITYKFVKLLNSILKSNNKKLINELENFDINKSIIEILKKCYF